LLTLGRRRGVMSQRFKEELVKELGFYDVVQREGWGAIRAKDAGNMVKLAIEKAERQLAEKMK
jgi:small acid-soluble spore protein F (minor alpha/beta-type SASP)